MTDKTEVVLVERDGPVAIVTLNRPDSLNALNPELMRRLPQVVGELAEDESARCVVLTGAGKGFCAGGDAREISKAANARVEGVQPAKTDKPPSNSEQRAAWLRRCGEASRLLHEMPKPSIAMINGACAGAGMNLAAACDIRIAANSAVFRSVFTTMGLSGDYGGSWLWTHILGTARARQLFFIDEKHDAEAALEFGLIDRVLRDGELRDEVLALAHRLAVLPGSGLALAKANLNAALTDSLAASLDRESLAMIEARDILVELRRKERSGPKP
ncbi:MAG: enoyl-CoA hydratase/isomerase family protein [Novosphingobium sp.]|nr:enoyl-CoA hydratase/isomerase family protein [Novosphingobium sp.]